MTTEDNKNKRDTDTGAPLPSRKKRGWWLYLLTTVFVVIVAGLLIFPPTRFMLWMLAMASTSYVEEVTPFLAKLEVDMEVNGQPVHIERILECASIRSPGGDLSTMRWFRKITSSHYVTVGALGKKLPDGSAVMMWTPYLCAQTPNPEGVTPDRTINTSVKSPPDDFIPFTAWTPNPDAPPEERLIELYTTSDYFKRPDARVKYKRVQVSDAPSGSKAAPPDKFSWFAQSHVKDGKVIKWAAKPRRGWYVYSFGQMHEDEWRGKNLELDAYFDNLTEPTVLDGTHLLPKTGKSAAAVAARFFTKAKKSRSVLATHHRRGRYWGEMWARKTHYEDRPHLENKFYVTDEDGVVEFGKKNGIGLAPLKPSALRNKSNRILVGKSEVISDFNFGVERIYYPKMESIIELRRTGQAFGS